MSRKQTDQKQNKIKSINKRTLVALQRINTIFINSDNSKTPKPHILILKLTNKLDLRKSFVLSNLSIHYTWKNTK